LKVISQILLWSLKSSYASLRVWRLFSSRFCRLICSFWGLLLLFLSLLRHLSRQIIKSFSFFIDIFKGKFRFLLFSFFLPWNTVLILTHNEVIKLPQILSNFRTDVNFLLFSILTRKIYLRLSNKPTFNLSFLFDKIPCRKRVR